MPTPTLHVVCGFAGGDVGRISSAAKQPLFRDPAWSEEPAANTPTANAAPDENGQIPVMRITVTQDVYVSIRSAPDASVSPRHLLLASNPPVDLYVDPNDRLEWVLA
jgi:hypothetical protein